MMILKSSVLPTHGFTDMLGDITINEKVDDMTLDEEVDNTAEGSEVAGDKCMTVIEVMEPQQK